MAKDFIRFCSAEKQATLAMKQIVEAKLTQSVGTNRNFKESLKLFCENIKENKQGDLQHATKEMAYAYLEKRSGEVAQKTLDMDRQAIQCYFVAKGEMKEGERLDVIKSEKETVLERRAYTPEQVALVASSQNERNAFATELAYASGLRAHELLTIRTPQEQPAHVRLYESGELKGQEKNLDTKWQGRDGVIYTVAGKGGLIREVLVPQNLADRLETHRLDNLKSITDRGVHYQQRYDIAGGNKWSSSFTNAAKRTLGWSTGAHGLRHSYAQERLKELEAFCPRDKALETVSQEMGHFRPDVTTVYLR